MWYLFVIVIVIVNIEETVSVCKYLCTHGKTNQAEGWNKKAFLNFDFGTGSLEEEYKYARYAFESHNILCINIFSSTSGPCQSYLVSI